MTIQVFRGQDTSGIPLHDVVNGGFVGTNAPGPLTAPDGKFYVVFETNAIDTRSGWKATFSNSKLTFTIYVDTVS